MSFDNPFVRLIEHGSHDADKAGLEFDNEGCDLCGTNIGDYIGSNEDGQIVQKWRDIYIMYDGRKLCERCSMLP